MKINLLSEMCHNVFQHVITDTMNYCKAYCKHKAFTSENAVTVKVALLYDCASKPTNQIRFRKLIRTYFVHLKTLPKEHLHCT